MPADDGALFVALGHGMKPIERRGARGMLAVGLNERTKPRPIARNEQGQKFPLRRPRSVELKRGGIAHGRVECLALATFVRAPCGFESGRPHYRRLRRIEPMQDASAVVPKPPSQDDEQA